MSAGFIDPIDQQIVFFLTKGWIEVGHISGKKNRITNAKQKSNLSHKSPFSEVLGLQRLGAYSGTTILTETIETLILGVHLGDDR
ncbi:MAG: hypothetical protein ACYDCF_11555 [Burkholderiales bacterium]